MKSHHEHSENYHSNEHLGRKPSQKKALSLAFWLNLFFSMIELIGGVLTNSTAIIADAFHDFMDAGAIGIAILIEKVSGKKPTQQFTYGFKRFSLLSALALLLFLLIGSITMIIAAYKSFITPKDVHSIGMLWLAVLGLTVNGFAFLKIKKSGKHHHIHSHGGHNHNSESIMFHLLEDVLGWTAVLIGAVIIYFTGWNWIDGILTIGIALFIGFNASKNLIKTIKVILQSVPENVSISQLKTELKQIEGITNIHDLHVWTMDGSYHVGSLHAVVNNSLIKSEQEVRNTIISLLQTFNIQHPTVQIETSEIECNRLIG